MRAIHIRGLIRAAAAIAACVDLLGGCKPPAPPPADRADYAQSLNRYYEGHPMCLWPDSVRFPVEDALPGEIDERGFDALTDAGFLVRKQASRGAPSGSATFDLSPEGRSALNPDIFDRGAGNFCYGRRKVVSIDSARENSTITDLVDYHFAVADPAAWAREDTIQTAFPQVVSELASPHRAEATLLDTTDGWEVSGTPATIVPVVTEPHNSSLAKAKNLLNLGKSNPSTYAERSSF
jgi:hypothetical protein